MDLIGKTTINPILFYTGKFAGYATWIALFLALFNINLFNKATLGFSNYISFALLAIGLILVVLSLINLGSSTRLGIPNENTVFKTNGLYKVSRNPMYVGFNLLTISAIVYFLDIWIILLGIYSIAIYHLIILGEERFLEIRFSKDYKTYKKEIRRYL